MPRKSNLTQEESIARKKVRTQGMNYARAFLMQKYKAEYQELYTAYLRNRGVDIEISVQLIDERKVDA